MRTAAAAATGLVVLCLLAAWNSPVSAADAVSGTHQQLLRGRKLLQCWGWGCRGRGSGTGDQQFARNSAAIINSQYAIRQAVNSGAEPGVTRAATLYANDQAWLASSGWGNDVWRPNSWWGRRRA